MLKTGTSSHRGRERFWTPFNNEGPSPEVAGTHARTCAPTHTIERDVAAETEVASSLIPAQSRGTCAPRSAQENNKSVIYLLLVPPPPGGGSEASACLSLGAAGSRPAIRWSRDISVEKRAMSSRPKSASGIRDINWTCFKVQRERFGGT